jgi:peptidoglycan DL-endopeptidase CwlO
MHRAKHRAAGRASVDVLATTLVERFADTTGPRLESSGSPHGVATLTRPVAVRDDATWFGRTMPETGPLPVTATVAEGRPPLFDDAHDLTPSVRPGSSPLFGAARHAARGGGQVVDGPSSVRPHPLGSAVTATVLGAAATVTAVMTPPAAVETTGSLAPVQNAVPAPTPVAAPALTVPAPAAPAVAPEQPAMHVADLVGGVTADMQRLTPAVEARYTAVANSTALSPAAVRRAALTKAMSKIGTPYRYGASGPTAFDCSGLVKWSFANAGRALPRTSRAMAGVGTPVSRANLQPGDLVFFYKPISHVGIYIGNGKMVHASNRKSPVKVSDISRMPFTKAVRV